MPPPPCPQAIQDDPSVIHIQGITLQLDVVLSEPGLSLDGVPGHHHSGNGTCAAEADWAGMCLSVGESAKEVDMSRE